MFEFDQDVQFPFLGGWFHLKSRTRRFSSSKVMRAARRTCTLSFWLTDLVFLLQWTPNHLMIFLKSILGMISRCPPEASSYGPCCRGPKPRTRGVSRPLDLATVAWESCISLVGEFQDMFKEEFCFPSCQSWYFLVLVRTGWVLLLISRFDLWKRGAW